MADPESIPWNELRAQLIGPEDEPAVARRGQELLESVSFTCPRCSRVSSNPNDVREGYCGNCHAWMGGGNFLRDRLVDLLAGLLGEAAVDREGEDALLVDLEGFEYRVRVERARSEAVTRKPSPVEHALAGILSYVVTSDDDGVTTRQTVLQIAARNGQVVHGL